MAVAYLSNDETVIMSDTNLRPTGTRLTLMLCMLFLMSPHVGDAQELAPDDPLAPFAAFIGGQWHLDGSYLELEWGVGRRSVKARSYFVANDTAKLVSEGVWFWHPGEERIRGYFTAIDMPPVFFEYTTSFDGDTMGSSIRTFTAAGEEQHYDETWQLVDDQHYVWTLHELTNDGSKKVAGGTYTRQ